MIRRCPSCKDSVPVGEIRLSFKCRTCGTQLRARNIGLTTILSGIVFIFVSERLPLTESWDNPLGLVAIAMFVAFLMYLLLVRVELDDSRTDVGE